MNLWEIIDRLCDETNVKLYDFDGNLLETYDGKNSVEDTALFYESVNFMWIIDGYLCIELVYRKE